MEEPAYRIFRVYCPKFGMREGRSGKWVRTSHCIRCLYNVRLDEWGVDCVYRLP